MTTSKLRITLIVEINDELLDELDGTLTIIDDTTLPAYVELVDVTVDVLEE